MALVWLGLLSLLASCALGFFGYAPWVPTCRTDVARVLSLAELRPGERFVELGCGDGRVVRAAASIAGIHATGVELTPLFAFVAWVRVLVTQSTARIVWGDLFQFDCRGADVVYCFGMSRTVGGRLAEKLRRELRPGARIISYAFPIPGLTLDRTDSLAGAISLYRYRV